MASKAKDCVALSVLICFKVRGSAASLRKTARSANRASTSLNSRSPSLAGKQALCRIVKNAKTMPAIRFQAPSAVSESAVSETAKRVHAKALDLLTRRAEINRRIRCLQKLMQRLQEFATNSTFAGSDVAAPERKTERTRPRNNNTQHGHTVGQMRSSLPRPSKQLQAGLMRACRIALMEAGGAASPDEIRTRIVRRGSFSFADSGSADAAIIRTLNTLTDGGEIQRLEDGPQSLWQRVAPEQESDTLP
jgi:hypothetical protein